MERDSMAASAPEVAFFVHNTDHRVNIKINTAMFKNNNSIMPGAYVSPALKWVNTRTRSVYAVSPTYGGNNEAGATMYLENDGEDIDL